MRFYSKDMRRYLTLPLLMVTSLSGWAGSEGAANGHFSLGLGYAYQKGPLRQAVSDPTIFFSGRYQWRGLFAEFANGTSGAQTPPTVGYNFHNSDHWNFDAIVAWTDLGTSFKGNFNGEYQNLSTDSSAGLGLRATGAYGDYTLQLVALSQSDNDMEEGYFGAAWLARNWQLKNWSIQGLFGAQYRSEEVMDYYFGVSERDAGNGFFPAYNAEAGTRYTVQLDASYPISQHWVFQTYTRHTEFSKSAKDSPLMVFLTEHVGRPESELEFGLLINYVF